MSGPSAYSHGLCRATASAAVFAVLLLCVAGCGRRAKVIPRSTMAAIYADMFMADEWLRHNMYAKPKADTTLFFEPVFAKYGYTKADYVATVDEYVKNPEQYAKILRQSSQILDKRIRKYKKLKKLKEHADSVNAAYTGHYKARDFSSDSVLFSGSDVFWNPYVEVDDN